MKSPQDRFTIKAENAPLLKQLLWLDVALGGVTGLVGLTLFNLLEPLLGLSVNFILIVCGVTLFYAIVAFVLANQKLISVRLLKALIYANWFWSIVSVVLLVLFFEQAYWLGKAFLILQVLVVGGLAYAEGKALQHVENS